MADVSAPGRRLALVYASVTETVESAGSAVKDGCAAGLDCLIGERPRAVYASRLFR